MSWSDQARHTLLRETGTSSETQHCGRGRSTNAALGTVQVLQALGLRRSELCFFWSVHSASYRSDARVSCGTVRRQRHCKRPGAPWIPALAIGCEAIRYHQSAGNGSELPSGIRGATSTRVQHQSKSVYASVPGGTCRARLRYGTRTLPPFRWKRKLGCIELCWSACEPPESLTMNAMCLYHSFQVKRFHLWRSPGVQQNPE